MLRKDTELGNKLRTKGLVKISHQMASSIGSSTVKTSCSQISIEGVYRFLRNDKVDADNIAVAGLNSRLPALTSSNTILTLEDTSTLCQRHNVTK